MDHEEDDLRGVAGAAERGPGDNRVHPFGLTGSGAHAVARCCPDAKAVARLHDVACAHVVEGANPHA